MNVNQLMLDIPQYGHWMVTHKGDRSCRLLADRHYSRQTVGHPMFTRPGRNLVLRTADGMATWVTWYGIRDDGLQAFECTIFRNETSILSSELIKDAVTATKAEWGKFPKDGMITYVAADKIRSTNAGYCFKRAGWKRIGESKKRGLVLLQFSDPTESSQAEERNG